MMRKLSNAELKRKSPEELKQTIRNPVIAVLENIRSAYNVGSVFRTADAFLIEAVYLVGYTACPPHKEIKKTALGAEEVVPWKHYKLMVDAMNDLREAGYKIFAVEQAMDSIPLYRFHDLYRGNIALIFGNEIKGVEQNTLLLCDGCVEIPQWGFKHSLNMATAAGVVLWEIIRMKADSLS
ncbi:MAG: RNA methyltransferase [Chitinophagaceae bacterium]|nr:RNA methyltransferase [Chitinophagaceae bacterium]